MGCRQSKKEKLEEEGAAAEGETSDQKLIVVFGATGHQGGSVVRALKDADGFKVRAVTRNPDGDKAKALAEDGIEVVQGDAEDVDSLKKALDGAYGVFIVTAAGLTDAAIEKEVKQGKNIADAAKECDVKHLVFSGLEDVEELIGKRCCEFGSKVAIEKHIKELDLPCTIVYMAFYYENLEAAPEGAPPHIRKGEDNYILDVPVGDNALDMMSLDDLGACIKTVFGDPDEYKGKTLALSAGKVNMEDVAAILAKHLEEKVASAGFTPEDVAKKDFAGAADMAVMFEFLTHEKCNRDIDLTQKLNPDVLTFDQWVEKNKDRLRKAIVKDE